MDKIKPCPLCGSSDDLEYTPAMHTGKGFVNNPIIECLGCQLRLTETVMLVYKGYGYDGSDESLERANETLIRRWNSMPRRRRRRGETDAET